MNTFVWKRTRLVLFTALCVTSPWLMGCGHAKSGPTPTYVYVIDYSGSTAATRKQQLGLMFAELESAPEETNVVIYRMGSDTQEIFSGPLGDSGTDTLIGPLKRDVLTSDAVRGTIFAKMTTALVAFSKTFTGTSYKLRVLTDGGNDYLDAQSLKAYREGAITISRDKRMSSIIFYGVQPEFRQQIRTAFGSTGPKLQILSQDQIAGL